MSSFYGGKQGRTYHIVQRYNSVADMVAAFSGGGAYSDVNYGQYVIIDTILVNHNKTSPQNGLLYRRGFDYNDNPDNYPKPNKSDSIYYDGQGNFKEEQWNTAWLNWVEHPGAGALYIGQIVGPQGQTPEIILESWEELNQKRGREAKTIVPASTTFGDNQNPVLDADGNIRKYSDNTPIWYGDLVKVGSYTTVDDYGNVNGAQLAFDIPRPVLKTQVVNTNPYLVSTVTENAASTAHPFYYKWDFEIPGGKHGQDIKEIVKQTGSAINNSTVDGQGNPIVGQDEYLTYTITNYDNGQPGDTDAAAAASTAHLGRWPYRVINKIEPILKTRGNVITPARWEENDYVPQIGDLYREDGNNGYEPDMYWVCVKSGKRDSADDKPKGENATLANLGAEDASLGECVWRVVNIPQTTSAHSLDIDYKAGANSTVSNLRNVDYLTVDKDGKMYVFYADSDSPYYLTTVRSIESLYYDSSIGRVRIKYYGQAEDNLYNPKVINKVTYSTGLLSTQGFQIHYDDGDIVPVSERTNVIAATRRLGDNLLFLYSDPEMRSNIPEEKRITFDQVWTDYLTGSTYAPNSLVWYNFGPLGAQYHVQGVYLYSDLIAGGILEHGFDHVEGLEDRAGWLVTVIVDQTIDGQTVKVPHIYAFDCTEQNSAPSHSIPNGQGGTSLSHWYEVMSLTAASLNPNFFVAASTSQPDTLSDNGFWFVVSYGHDEEVNNNG